MPEIEAQKAERVTLHFDVPRELRDVVARQAKERLCSVSAHARYLLASAIELQAERTMGNRR